MSDWKSEIREVKKKVRDASRVELSLPPYFNFKDHDAFDFDKALRFFNWELKDRSVAIDISKCRSANYQTLSLLILYAWKLKSNGCRVDFGGTTSQERYAWIAQHLSNAVDEAIRIRNASS